jgi:hypothetical protein
VERESRESKLVLEAEQLRARVTELERQCTPPRTAATPRHSHHHSPEGSPLRLPLPPPSPLLSPATAAHQQRAEERLHVAQRTLHSAVSQLHSLADSVAAPSPPSASAAAVQVSVFFFFALRASHPCCLHICGVLELAPAEAGGLTEQVSANTFSPFQLWVRLS